jgi:DNA-binding transcriptional LysR family regulator
VADVGFASMAVYSPNLEIVELFEDELVLVCGKKHKLTKKREVSIRDLADERWILFERGSSIRRATDDFFKQKKIEPETALESNDTYFIKIMIEHGLGISLLPAWAIGNEVKNGDLKIIKVRKLNLTRSVAMVGMKGLQPAPIRAFTKFIFERREELQRLAKL